MPFLSVYVPGRRLPRSPLIVALSSKKRAESIDACLAASILPTSPASALSGIVTATLPSPSPWNGWKVALAT